MAIDVYKEWLGIPEASRPPDHYALLRLVQFEDDTEKIRGNYKKLNAHVRKYATGTYSTESQVLLNELAKAMLCLTDPERKREYDESLGREFEDETTALGRRPLGQVLVDQGTLTKDQLKETEHFAEQRGLSLRDAVVQMKLADAETAAKALAEELGLSYVDLDDMPPDDSVLDKVPRNLVKRNKILPLFVDDDTLLVACIDEPTHELEDELRLRYGVPVRRVLSTPLAINQAIAKYYAPGMRDEAAPEEAVAAETPSKKKAAGAAKKPKRKQPRKAVSQMTDEELAQRKQIGYIMILWGVTVPAILSYFFLEDANVIVKYLPAALIAPAVIAYVTLVYWKK